MGNSTSLLQHLKVKWWEWDHTLVEEGKMGLDISSGWEFPHMYLFMEVCNREMYLMRHIDIYYGIKIGKIHSISFISMLAQNFQNIKVKIPKHQGKDYK